MNRTFIYNAIKSGNIEEVWIFFLSHNLNDELSNDLELFTEAMKSGFISILSLFVKNNVNNSNLLLEYAIDYGDWIIEFREDYPRINVSRLALEHGANVTVELVHGIIREHDIEMEILLFNYFNPNVVITNRFMASDILRRAIELRLYDHVKDLLHSNPTIEITHAMLYRALNKPEPDYKNSRKDNDNLKLLLRLADRTTLPEGLLFKAVDKRNLSQFSILIRDGSFVLTPLLCADILIYLIEDEILFPDAMEDIRYLITNHFISIPNFHRDIVSIVEMNDNQEILYSNIRIIFHEFTLDRVPGDVKIVSDIMGSQIYWYINRGLLSKDSVQNLLEKNFEYMRKNLLSDIGLGSIASTEIRDFILDYAKVRFQLNRDFFHGRVSRDVAKLVHEFGYYH
jgi:hypothetical protein